MSEVDRLFHTMNKVTIPLGLQLLAMAGKCRTSLFGCFRCPILQIFFYYLGSSSFTPLNFQSISFHCIRSTSHIFHIVSSRRPICCYRPSMPTPSKQHIYLFSLLNCCIILELLSGHHAPVYMCLDFLVVDITFWHFFRTSLYLKLWQYN